MTEPSAKRPRKMPIVSNSSESIEWQHNFAKWEILMNSPMLNVNIEDNTFLIPTLIHNVNKNCHFEYKIIHIPNITYRQYARLVSHPDVKQITIRK